jgi:hypothetical protein
MLSDNAIAWNVIEPFNSLLVVGVLGSSAPLPTTTSWISTATKRKVGPGPWAPGSAIWSLRQSLCTGTAASPRLGASGTITFDTSSSGTASIPSHTFDGGFIGGGTEIAVQAWPGLFWRSEYRYSSYRSADLQLSFDGVPEPGYIEHETKNVQTITTSLVWKFNWTGH